MLPQPIKVHRLTAVLQEEVLQQPAAATVPRPMLGQMHPPCPLPLTIKELVRPKLIRR